MLWVVYCLPLLVESSSSLSSGVVSSVLLLTRYTRARIVSNQKTALTPRRVFGEEFLTASDHNGLHSPRHLN